MKLKLDLITILQILRRLKKWRDRRQLQKRLKGVREEMGK